MSWFRGCPRTLSMNLGSTQTLNPKFGIGHCAIAALDELTGEERVGPCSSGQQFLDGTAKIADVGSLKTTSLNSACRVLSTLSPLRVDLSSLIVPNIPSLPRLNTASVYVIMIRPCRFYCYVCFVLDIRLPIHHKTAIAVDSTCPTFYTQNIFEFRCSAIGRSAKAI